MAVELSPMNGALHETTIEGQLHLRWKGRISGPFTRSALLSMYRLGQITKHHEVSGDQIHWHPFGQSGLLNVKSRECLVGSGREFESPDVSLGNCADEGGPCQTATAAYPTLLSVDPTDGRRMDLHAKSLPWILVFGISPLLVFFFQQYFGLRFAHVAWLFSVYFGVIWAWILGGLANWRLEIWKRGVTFAAFTALAGIGMLLVWRFIPIVALLYASAQGANAWVRFMGCVLGVGFCEELCKAAPLILFGFRSEIMRTPGDGLFLGMMSGLGFAVSEGLEYTLNYWSDAVDVSATGVHDCLKQAADWYGTVNQDAFMSRLGDLLPALFEHYGQLVTAQIARFMSLPLLHATWAGIVGFGLAKTLRTNSWGWALAGLATAAMLHGLYDFFSSGIIGLVVAAASIFLVVGVLLQQAHFKKVNTQ